VIGLLAPLLQKAGNPANMGICVACFERDIAGALGLHRAAVVQYIRRRLSVLCWARSLRRWPSANSKPAPVLRRLSVLCWRVAMIGALAFLGCPWRALLRLSGGDLNAILGLAGLVVGIAVGVQFLKSGYSLGRSTRTYVAAGWVMPALMVGCCYCSSLVPI